MGTQEDGPVFRGGPRVRRHRGRRAAPAADRARSARPGPGGLHADRRPVGPRAGRAAGVGGGPAPGPLSRSSGSMRTTSGCSGTWSPGPRTRFRSERPPRAPAEPDVVRPGASSRSVRPLALAHRRGYVLVPCVRADDRPRSAPCWSCSSSPPVPTLRPPPPEPTADGRHGSGPLDPRGRADGRSPGPGCTPAAPRSRRRWTRRWSAPRRTWASSPAGFAAQALGDRARPRDRYTLSFEGSDGEHRLAGRAPSSAGRWAVLR